MAGSETGAVRVRGTLLGENTPNDIVVRGGRIASIAPAGKQRPDAGSSKTIIAPTLFDIQINGCGGHDLQRPDVTPATVARVSDELAKAGVSHWIPTFITASLRDLEHGCRVIAETLRDRAMARRIPGVHIEGPYISPEDGPRGAHAKRHVRKPDLREFDRLYKAADGKVAYITTAPELPGAIPFIKEVASRGVVVSLGHHNATPDQIRRAVDAGARLCTHLGNGLAAQINRHHNPLWPQLADDRLACSLIPDLEHLPADVLKIFTRVKGPQACIFTSDAVHLAGMKPGRYQLGEMPVELKRSGRICLVGTELLAGSAIGLLQGIVNAAHVTDFSLKHAFASATTVPAKLFRLPYRFPPPAVGAPASFIAFDIVPARNRPRAVPQAVFIDGKRYA
ncbi:MAG: hypothetical protein AMXMBFR4_00060 [Candidatus Hydrogenedentota bacterium]